MIYVLFTDTTPLNDEKIYAYYYNKASKERREKASKARLKKDKNLCVGASVLINTFLSEKGIFRKNIEYEKGENGKPYFKNLPQIHFNISHSENIVMAVFSDSEIGCDIEKVKKADINLAKRFFHENEYFEIAKKETEDEINNTFFRLWTLKESYIKQSGKGLSLPLNSFCINLCENGAKLNGNDEYRFYEISDFDGFKAAVCTKSDDEIVTKKIIIN